LSGIATIVSEVLTRTRIERAEKHRLSHWQLIFLQSKDYLTEEGVLGRDNAGDRLKMWCQLGDFWGGLAGLLMGSIFYSIPGIGPVIVLGPLVMNTKPKPTHRRRSRQPNFSGPESWYEAPSYDNAMPEQFFDSRIKLAAVCPETALMYAVFEDAFLCFHKQFEPDQLDMQRARG
jgi:hypothetical protein